MAGKEETRQHILDTSLRLFVARGYGNTTIRDIAAEASISVGLLFHYFDSKPALLKAHVMAAGSGIDAAIALLDSDASAMEIFDRIAHLTMDGLADPTARLWYALVNQPLPAEVVGESLRGEELLARSATVVLRGQAAGEIREGNPVSLAMAFWGAVQGCALMLVGVDAAPAPQPEWLLDILRRK